MSHGPVRQEVIFAMAGSALAPLKLGLIKGIFNGISDGISYGMIFIQYGFIPSGVIKHGMKNRHIHHFLLMFPAPRLTFVALQAPFSLLPLLAGTSVDHVLWNHPEQSALCLLDMAHFEVFEMIWDDEMIDELVL